MRSGWSRVRTLLMPQASCGAAEREHRCRCERFSITVGFLLSPYYHYPGISISNVVLNHLISYRGRVLSTSSEQSKPWLISRHNRRTYPNATRTI